MSDDTAGLNSYVSPEDVDAFARQVRDDAAAPVSDAARALATSYVDELQFSGKVRTTRAQRDEFARILDAHADYRVLRRMEPMHDAPPDDPTLLRGLYLDCEATGLDTATARVIQLALVPFWFVPTGQLVAVGAGCSWYEDPGIPIPPEVTALTGISDADVAGQHIDDAAVNGLASGAALIIAHNADYDRKVMERRASVFVPLPWACSYRDVDWKGLYGAGCGKLAHLLADTCGQFHDGHRALDDCCAGVHILAHATRETDSGPTTAFADLLARARHPTYRVALVNTSYDFNMTLKLRGGYRWHDGKTGRPKEWFRDCTPAEHDTEVTWLESQHVRPVVRKFNARHRYSMRTE